MNIRTIVIIRHHHERHNITLYQPLSIQNNVGTKCMSFWLILYALCFFFLIIITEYHLFFIQDK